MVSDMLVNRQPFRRLCANDRADARLMQAIHTKNLTESSKQATRHKNHSIQHYAGEGSTQRATSMAFLQKLVKSVTGSWADVSLQAARMTPGLTRNFEVNVAVTDEAIEFSRIVAVVRCTETARVSVSNTDDNSFGNDTETDSATVSEETITLRGPGTFKAGHRETFSFPVTIPREGPFSFNGRYVDLEWKCKVSIDMRGNDPDSGWETFEVGSPV